MLFDLNNGIKVVCSKSKSEVVHIGLLVGVGAKDDGKVLSGMSHFIEHMWFKGTINLNSNQIVESIEKYGGDFNAYTSKEETCIYISVLKDYIEVAFKVLADVYFNSVFPENELNKERDVIIDEIHSYEDSPSELIFDDFEERLFLPSDLSNSILGNVKSLKKIDSKNINTFYKEKYLNSKVVLSVVGNISHDVVLSLSKNYFECNILTINEPKILLNDILNGQSFNIKKNKKTNQAHCLFGRTCFSWHHNDRLAMSMLSNIIGGPHMSSLLNFSLREKNGLSYTVESNYVPFLENGSFVVYFGTEKRNVEKCNDIIQSEFKNICSSDIIDKKIDDYKMQLLGQLSLSNDNNLSVMLSQARSILIFDKVESFKDIKSKILSITSTKLKDVANRILLFDKMSFLEYN